jgi:hypothetical protein
MPLHRGRPAPFGVQALILTHATPMDADGWRTRKRKADTPASDLATARARAEVLDVQHAEKKFKAARARKLGKGPQPAADTGSWRRRWRWVRCWVCRGRLSSAGKTSQDVSCVRPAASAIGSRG